MTRISWIDRSLCPVCSSDQRRFLLDKEGTYVRCKACSLVYTSPAQSDDKLKEIADEWAKKHHASLEKTLWEGNQELQEIVYGPRMSKFERYRSNGRILDVGCSTGDFLSHAKSKDWEVYGSELAEHTAQIAQRRLNCEVRHGTFESSNFEADFFDIVTMWDVVEHVLEPKELVAEAFRILRPGGALVLFTPNYNSLTRRLIFDRWSALIPERHMCVFNKSTIRLLIEQCGGRIVAMRICDINPHEILRGEREETLGGLKNRQLAMGRMKGLLVKYPLLQFFRRAVNWILNLTGTGDVIELHALKN